MSSLPSSVGQLPARLRNFLARYPPQIYSSIVAERPAPPEAAAAPEETLPSPYTPDREAKGAHRQDPTAYSPSRAILQSETKGRNPFLPRKVFTTGKWIGPRYGLRQQADLVKLAIKYNVEPLLPIGPKSTEYKAARLAERGLRIKGTGIGQKVKGHKWERTMEARLEDRRKAMLEMPEMIRLWKQVSLTQVWMVAVWVLIVCYREVMVVAGGSGPSGKQGRANKPVLSVFPSLLVHSSSSTAAFFGPNFQQGICMNSLQGFRKGVFSILHHFTSSVLYYAKIGHSAQDCPSGPERASCHCA